MIEVEIQTRRLWHASLSALFIAIAAAPTAYAAAPLYKLMYASHQSRKTDMQQLAGVLAQRSGGPTAVCRSVLKSDST